MQPTDHAKRTGRPARARARRSFGDLAVIGSLFFSGRGRFIAFAGFMLLVALTGGGSRPDIQSLLILRPASVVFFAYGLAVFSGDSLRIARAPLSLLLGLLILALLQLVPLPPEIWTGLPGREVVVDASSLMGMGGIFRPLSLDPDRTWNTVFALFAPLAIVVLAAVQVPERRQHIITVLIAVALLSALLGFLQAVGGQGLQFYKITHVGFPTGLFANKNHQSVMLLWLMLAGCWLATTVHLKRKSVRAAIGGSIALILVLFPLLILTGSRAGLLLSLPTLAVSFWLLLRSPAARTLRERAGRRYRLIVGAGVAVLVGPLIFVFGVLAVSDRRTALSRLFENGAADDARFRYLPHIWRMARDFLPLGSGFGSFEKVFNSYEPANEMTIYYMNQAHDDAVQLVIEGGIPALLIALSGLAWFISRIYRTWRSRRPGDRDFAIFVSASAGLWLCASLVDYPLRTPLAASLFAALTVLLSMRSYAVQSELAPRSEAAIRSSSTSQRIDSR